MSRAQVLARPSPGAGKILWESGLFDPDWYRLRAGADDRMEGNPLDSFLTVGWRLGSDPGQGFNSRAYLATYGDVAVSGKPAYDQLCGATRPDPITDGSLVNAISEQSWRNPEILVVDDASTDGTLAVAQDAARTDSRIRVIAQNRNQGAYVARNRALSKERSAFVTFQDSDDWCHPERIARQVTLLMQAPNANAGTAQHARIKPDLCQTRLSPESHFISDNTASLLFHRAPVVERLGCWDEVRVGTDNDLIRRMRRLFGETAVENAFTGPLSLMRDRPGSAVRSGPLGIDGHVTGARLAYLEAALLYWPGQLRPFPAPAIMWSRDPGTLPLFRAGLEVGKVRLLAPSLPTVKLTPSGRCLRRYEPAQCEAAAKALSGGRDPEWWAATSRGLRATLAQAGAARLMRRTFSTQKPGRVLR